MKLAVFDFDSTLMQGETLEFIAKEFGIEPLMKKITTEAMEGKIDFFESLLKRVSLLRGAKESKIKEICENLPYTKGAKETITELKKQGYKVVCFSGGYETATIPAQKVLGYDAQFSNIFHFKNGELTGMLGGEMMFSDSKGKMLKRLQNLFNINKEDTLAVGDGANDLSMFNFAGNRAAFCAKPILKEHANIIIDIKDLTELLNYL
ncbi:MAG: phosphoserine phosphatase SerB [Candidatus Gastranaerophilales bacterium]|nr:phosphoserine phosphatase SerB [Candidatus Gastranaerophilales bacterium]